MAFLCNRRERRLLIRAGASACYTSQVLHPIPVCFWWGRVKSANPGVLEHLQRPSDTGPFGVQMFQVCVERTFLFSRSLWSLSLRASPPGLLFAHCCNYRKTNALYNFPDWLTLVLDASCCLVTLIASCQHGKLKGWFFWVIILQLSSS